MCDFFSTTKHFTAEYAENAEKPQEISAYFAIPAVKHDQV